MISVTLARMIATKHRTSDGTLTVRYRTAARR